jgi:neutral ceramidase
MRLLLWARNVALTAVVLSSIGCAGLAHATLGIVVHEHVVVPGYKLNVFTPAPRLRAGVGKVDITPPPGYPTGGHGPAGDIARGYWLRLYARAFFFTDPAGRALVLVSCDLFAMPAGLRELVAQRVATTWNARGVLIRPEAILLAATHTHQSPGNFMTSSLYNGFGSVKAGFSRELFEFLAKRIASAIDVAVSDGLDPHNGDTVITLRIDRRQRDFLLNRSPRTFLLNWNAQRLMDGWANVADHCQPTVESGEPERKIGSCRDVRDCEPSIRRSRR